MAFEHKSVLLEETIEGLAIKPDGIYVDGTLGGGGHAYEVCRRLSNKGSFIGIDQDAAAIEAASERLLSFGERVTIIRSNYCDMKLRLHEIGIDKVDGIVLDLGVSSYQLDTADRGFSYRADAPLDMRMDNTHWYTIFFTKHNLILLHYHFLKTVAISTGCGNASFNFIFKYFCFVFIYATTSFQSL